MPGVWRRLGEETQAVCVRFPEPGVLVEAEAVRVWSACVLNALLKLLGRKFGWKKKNTSILCGGWGESVQKL